MLANSMHHTNTKAESNESITDMTEGLPFFPLLRSCIEIRKLPAVVLSYEGQIETSPSLPPFLFAFLSRSLTRSLARSLACTSVGFRRTRNTVASRPPINSLRVWWSEFLTARPDCGIKPPQNVYPTAV